MRSRRASREAALQALYQCDTLNDFGRDTVALFFKTFYTPEALAAEQALEEEGAVQEPTNIANQEFSEALIFGVIERVDFIDSQLNLASTHWSVARMSRVDRNILRIGAYELAFCEETPKKVVLNEAIEIAKRFGSDESAVFINGVLDKVAASFAAKPEILEALNIKNIVSA